MRPVQIIPVKCGMVNAYIIRQDGVILIDTGVPGSEDPILNALEVAGIGQREIRLILVTHGHGDHAGSAARLQEITGAPVAVHQDDAPMLRTGIQRTLVPVELTGRIAAVFIRSVNTTKYPPVNPAIIINGTLDLAPYGIIGSVIPTPGHTTGSVSALLGDGDVFTGDLISPQIPSREPGLPFWADNPAEISTSVKMLLAYNPRTFHTGHGGPFPVAFVRKMVEENPKKIHPDGKPLPSTPDHP